MQRYRPNSFVQNRTNKKQQSDNGNYFYYIRPFIPFASIQELTFETVNQCDKIQAYNEGSFPRGVLSNLTKTWLLPPPNDREWFDSNTVLNELKESLRARIMSTYKYCNKNDGGTYVFYDEQLMSEILFRVWYRYDFFSFI